MLSSNYIEWIGYAASVFIVISLTMTSMVKLRIINSIGCFLFVVYGLFVNASPVVLSNALIIFINLYNLNKGRAKQTNIYSKK